MSNDDQPFALHELKQRAPWWPYSPWATAKRIRDGKMAAIRDGRRRFLSVALLRRYLDEHVTAGQVA